MVEDIEEEDLLEIDHYHNDVATMQPLDLVPHPQRRRVRFSDDVEEIPHQRKNRERRPSPLGELPPAKSERHPHQLSATARKPKVKMAEGWRVVTLNRESRPKNTNRKRSDAPKYEKGDMVMLNTKNLKTGRPAEKLTHDGKVHSRFAKLTLTTSLSSSPPT